MFHWASTLSLNQKLGLAAVILGAITLLGNVHPGRIVTLHEKEFATAVAQQIDHVPASELAGWILTGRADYRLVDIRDEKAYATYHIPTAENMPLASLTDSGLARNEKIVLYGEGGIRAAQAWMLLKGKGYIAVHTLAGGLDDWKNEVLFPVTPENPTPAEQARFEQVAHVAKFFGGQPRAAGMGAPAPRLDVPKIEAAAPAVPAPALPGAAGRPAAPKKKEGC
jgi:rhodanese-related sulfurtransferase